MISTEDITFAELGIEMLINNYEHIFNNGIRTYQPSDEMKHILNKKLLKIFIGTWNVGNHPITNEAALTDWLHPTSKKFLPPDVYAIGFQVAVKKNEETKNAKVGPTSNRTVTALVEVITIQSYCHC